MKARLSIKLIGETLEQHCETESNRIRAAAFPRAYFEKDKDAKLGSKGEYILRDLAEGGTKIAFIMFEMKDEDDRTATKGRNDDFLKQLSTGTATKKAAWGPDRQRTTEYATAGLMPESICKGQAQRLRGCWRHPVGDSAGVQLLRI